MIMVAACVVGRLTLRNVLTALVVHQCAVESVRRWVSETYNSQQFSYAVGATERPGYCFQLGFCLICWVWSCWAPLGTNNHHVGAGRLDSWNWKNKVPRTKVRKTREYVGVLMRCAWVFIVTLKIELSKPILT